MLACHYQRQMQSPLPDNRPKPRLLQNHRSSSDWGNSLPHDSVQDQDYSSQITRAQVERDKQATVSKKA